MTTFEGEHDTPTGSSHSRILSKFGARLRTKTHDGSVASDRQVGEVSQGSPAGQLPRRPSAVGEGRKRHSYNVLGRKHSASDLLSSLRSNRQRSGSKIFNSLSASFARASIHDEEEAVKGVQLNSHNTDEEANTTKTSSSNEDDNQGYQQVGERGSPPELTDSLNIHYTSASAYDTQPAIVPDEPSARRDGVSDEADRNPRRKRRLSVSLLSQRWSRADLGGGLDEPDAGPSPHDATQTSFNLHSFRNVRRASDLSWDRRPVQARSDSDTSAYAGMTDVQRHSYALSTGTQTPPPITHSPDGTPRRSQQSRSRTASTGASMSAGMFMRAAARSSRMDVQTCNDEDKRGMHSSAAPQRASPYRPLTPLGQGAQSPAEELAILEADLAKARSMSLAYLAQLEEKEMARQRRRMQYSGADEMALSPSTSYFAPAHQHREVMPQTNSLFERLQELESQQLRALER